MNKCESCGAPLRSEQIQCDYCGSFVKYAKMSYAQKECSSTTTHPAKVKYLSIERLSAYCEKVQKIADSDSAIETLS